MTTVPKRLAIKFNLKTEASFTAKAIMPIFQRWIQEHAVEGMLIDVVDYKHVHEGPGVILIADEGDYAYDLSEGKAGLLYVRKRSLPDNLADALQLLMRVAVNATQRFEDEDSLGGATFDYSSAKITFLDRLNYANSDETLSAIHDLAFAFLSTAYATQDITITRANEDSREAFAIQFKVAGDVSSEALAERLNSETITT